MPSRRLFLATLLAAMMVGAADAQGKGKGGSPGGSGGNSGNAGGNGNAGGKGGKPGGNGNAGGKKDAGNKAQAQSPVANEPAGPPAIRLRHPNGFEEEIGAGRYEMGDNRGRRIVNRAALLSDYARLRRLMAP